MARELKVGDRVQCRDGSWSFGIRRGRFSNGISDFPNDMDDLIIVALGLKVENHDDGLSKSCDMLVTNNNGSYWFVRSYLCRLIPQMHTITVAGKDIEISDESYENLKRQLAD